MLQVVSHRGAAELALAGGAVAEDVGHLGQLAVAAFDEDLEADLPAGWVEVVEVDHVAAEEEAAAPHRLYGVVDPARRYSVGDWLRDLAPVLDECRETGLRPIITGGTGLYFMALTEGLAEIPPPPEDVRAAVDARLKAEGVMALAEGLRRRDPETAAATAQPRMSRAVSP